MKTDYSVNDLKERVTLEKAVVTTDSELNRIPTYVPMRTVWAGMIPLKVGNRNQGVADDVKVYYTMVIRKQALKAPVKRVTWQGQRWYPTEPPVITDRWIIQVVAGDFADG